MKLFFFIIINNNYKENKNKNICNSQVNVKLTNVKQSVLVNNFDINFILLISMKLAV